MAIINNNVTNVKFLRNGSVFNTHNDAYNALTGFTLSDEQDGSAILARYTATDGNVKTLVGWVYKNGETEYVTIQDVEGASSDIMALLGGGVSTANTVTDQLEQLSGDTASTSADTSVEGAKRYAEDLIGELDGGVTAETGYYVKSVSEVDGKISGTTEALPSVGAISENGKAITAVSESNGEISATAGTIDAQYVDVTGFTATDVQGALEEVKNNIGEAISGLDYSDSAVAGEYVSQVSETDGKISVTRVALPSSADTAEAKKVVIAVSEDKGQIEVSRGSITSSGKTIVLADNADGGVNFEANVDGTTIIIDQNTGVMSVASSALVQYEGDTKTIEISEVQGGIRTVSTLLTLSSVTPSSEVVKEEYALKNASGETIGSTIKIYKDSHIVSIEYQDNPEQAHYQNLIYTYIDASGETQVEYVDISELVLEAEFASGVTVTNHVAHGVVDPTSETFLTVGSDGFKLSGVQDAIDSAVSGLDASVSAKTTHITVKVDEVDGKLTAVTLTEDDIASATALTKEISDRESGDTELSNRLGNNVTTTNTASAQLAALSGDPSTALSGDTSVEGAKKYADAKLADAVADLDATVTAATSGNHITISIEELDGKLVQSGLTIAEDNIANADDLAELSGKTVTALTSTNGSITASINDAAGNKTYNIETDASKIKMSGFTSTDILSGITPASSVTEAFMSLDDIISENERVTASALTDLDERVDEVSGKVETIETNYVSGVSVNGNAVTIASHVAPISVSAATSATTASTANAIVVDTDANGNITLGLNYIDCGFYD